MITKTTFKIEGMHCTSCAMNIDCELEDLGVKNVSTSYAKAETTVEYDNAKITVKKLQEAIKKLGYNCLLI